MGKSGGLKGSPNNGFIKFSGCANCSSNKCPTWTECEEILKDEMGDGKFRWNTGK